MGALVQDLRYGIRMLVKNPGFTAVAVLTLALGIGANTAIFSLIDAVLLKMLPVQNPRQLVLLAWTSKGWPEGVMSSLTGNMSGAPGGGRTSESLSYPTYERIRAGNSVFSSVLAMAADGDKVSVSFKGVPEMADADLVSGSFFTTLGVQPILGRALTPEDDKAGASPVAVISYGYWQRRFGRDPAAVGKAITVNSVPATIVGVAPPEFYGVRPGQAVEIWLPIHTQPQVEPRWSPEAPGQGAQTGAQPASVFEQSDPIEGCFDEDCQTMLEVTPAPNLIIPFNGEAKDGVLGAFAVLATVCETLSCASRLITLMPGNEHLN